MYDKDKDKEFLKAVARIAEELGVRSIRLRKLGEKNSYELRLGGLWLVRVLSVQIKRNCSEPSLSFIRGLTDAEGTAYHDKHCGVTIEIVNTNEEVVKRARQVLNNHGIKSHLIVERRRAPRKNLFKIRVKGKKSVLRFYEVVNPLHPRLLRRRPPSP